MESQNYQSYTIKTSGFEGPFGLLLELVEKRKLFINDVSLATVTEDYLQHMNKLGGLSPADISSFILVASTLILIKSKSLLPNLSLTTEEEGDIKSLEERLRLYEIFMKLEGNIKDNFGQKIIFSPLERKNEILVFLPDDRITKDSMMSFAKNVLGSMPKKVFLPEVEIRKVISIEEMIGKLTDRIQSSIQTSFKNFTGQARTREEKVFVIVGFLAMLELVRNGILNAIQENGFEDIIISKQVVDNESIL
ncbi:segregation/condensation protein A [Candidatus Nomurabacteria bacterium]|nr:segregation/condensation protein A [Candidatus Nomurabacteria bacterium]